MGKMNLRTLRLMSDLSQSEIARKTGLDLSTENRIMTGTIRGCAESRRKIAAELGVDANEILWPRDEADDGK